MTSVTCKASSGDNLRLSSSRSAKYGRITAITCFITPIHRVRPLDLMPPIFDTARSWNCSRERQPFEEPSVNSGERLEPSFPWARIGKLQEDSEMGSRQGVPSTEPWGLFQNDTSPCYHTSIARCFGKHGIHRMTTKPQVVTTGLEIASSCHIFRIRSVNINRNEIWH